MCFQKITARTVDLTDLARATPIFVTIHGARYRSTGDVLKAAVFADVPKPSQGGYIVNFNGCFWHDEQQTENYKCDNCDHTAAANTFPKAVDLDQRIDTDGVYTDKECPKCGALSYPHPFDPSA